jgi:hypothetical protein
MTVEHYLKLSDEEKNKFIAENIFGFDKDNIPCGLCAKSPCNNPLCRPEHLNYLNWQGFGMIAGKLKEYEIISINIFSSGCSVRLLFENEIDGCIDYTRKDAEASTPWDALVCAWIEIKESDK